MMIQAAMMPPSWVMPGAVLDADFANHRYWGCTISFAQSPSKGSSFGHQGVAADRRIGCLDERNRVHLAYPYTFNVAPGTGLWAERNTTNYALYSRDMSNAAWTKSSCTATRNQNGNDALETANLATLITATGSNATCLQLITLASTQVISSAFVKRSVGSGTIEMTQDGGSTWTDITSSINSSDYTRVSIAAQTLTDPQVGFRIVTSGDAIIVDFFQTENSDAVTSPMVTFGSTQQRGTSYTGILPQIGNLSTSDWTKNDGERIIRNLFFGTPASLYVEFSGSPLSGSPRVVGGSDGNVYLDGGAGLAAVWGNSDTGTQSTTANSGNSGQGNYNKVAGRIGGASCAACMNGGAIATNTSKVDFSKSFYSHIGLGSNGDGSAALGGNIRRMTIWRRELDDGELQRLTG